MLQGIVILDHTRHIYMYPYAVLSIMCITPYFGSPYDYNTSMKPQLSTKISVRKEDWMKEGRKAIPQCIVLILNPQQDPSFSSISFPFLSIFISLLQHFVLFAKGTL